MKRSTLSVGLAVLLLSLGAWAEEPAPARRALVLELVAQGVPRELAQQLTRVVAQELRRGGGLAPVPREELGVNPSPAEEKVRQGCDSAACLQALGDVLGVELLVVGSVVELAGTRQVVLTLIHLGEDRVVNRVTEPFEGEAAQFTGAARVAARRLAGRILDDPGLLDVQLSVEAARVLVDGEELERGGPRSVPPGKIRVRVEAEGYQPWERDVYIEPGELTRLDVGLEELSSPWYESWWLWTVVGAVVLAGAGVGVYYGVFAEQPTGTLLVTSAIPGGGR
jgi:hypothetical protein